jgi:hypothetical protein
LLAYGQTPDIDLHLALVIRMFNATQRLEFLFTCCCGILIAAGCKPPSSAQGEPHAPPTASSAGTTTPGTEVLRLQVVLNKIIDESEGTESFDNMESPSEAQIEQKVKSLNWDSMTDRPFVALTRTVDGKVTSTIQLFGTLKPSKTDERLCLVCRERRQVADDDGVGGCDR